MMKNTIQDHFKKMTFIAFFFLGFLIYAQALQNPFVMDDEIQILGNTHIQTLHEWPSFFTSSSMGSGGGEKMGGVYYKPLMTTYYAVVWHFFGPDPMAFRLPLLFIFILSAYLIFLFSLSFLPWEHAFFLGVICLLHPVNSEVVLYIADAQDVLYFFFGILSLYSLSKIENQMFLFGVLSILFSLGLLSKETGGLFLGVGCVYAILFQRSKLKVVLSSAILVGLLYLGVRFSIGLTETRNTQLLFSAASFSDRLSMLPLVLGHYIEIYFFPNRLSLATDFILKELSWGHFWGPLLLVSFFFLLVNFLGFRYLKAKEKAHFNFFLFIFLFWFILHTHLFIPLDGVYADRWFYMGVWIFSSWIFLLLSQRSMTKGGIILLSLIVLGLSLRSYSRSLDWKVPLTLYQREVALHPWDALMINNVGVELFRQNHPLEAEPYFIKAIEMNSHWPVAWNNLGAVKERRLDYSAALSLYKRAIELQSYPLAYENYASLLVNLGQNEKAYYFLKEQALPLYGRNPTLLDLWEKLKMKSRVP